MTDKSKDEPLRLEDETSLLLNEGPEISPLTDNEDTIEVPANKSVWKRVFNRFFLLEVFAHVNYIVGIVNILYIAMLYLHLYTPQSFERFAHECAPKIEMSVFLDLILSLATVLLFSNILRYMRQVG